MIKTAFILLAFSFLLVSCKPNPTPAQNSWTFKGVKYTTPSCGQRVGSLIASDASGTSTLTVNYYTQASGVYTVVYDPDNSLSANQASIVMSINNGATYTSSGGNGNEKVNLTVSNTGDIEIKASNITVVHGSDTSSLSFDITQK